MTYYVSGNTAQKSRISNATMQRQYNTRLNGLRGLSEARSPLAAQIVATAEAWISHANSFQGGNTDKDNLTPLVNAINRCAGLANADGTPSKINGQGAAYCLSWTWLVVKGAIECLQGVNCLPLESGSTWRMLASSKNSRVARVDTTPAVGSVFFRGRMYYSGANAGTSRNVAGSGHCGIVTKVLSDGGFEYVDANGRKSELNGTAINRDTYTRADIDKYNRSDTAVSRDYLGITGKFQFVHVEECAVQGTSILDIVRIKDNCMPECRTREITPPPPVTVVPPPPTPPRPGDPPPRTPPPTRPAEKCPDNVIIVPCSRALTISPDSGVSHFSAFRKMSRDVKEKWFSRLKDDDIAGISDTDPFAILARFPVVKDTHGKKIVVVPFDPEVEGGKLFQRINEQQLWGKGEVVFYHLERRWNTGLIGTDSTGYFNQGWAERAALDLLTPISDGGKETLLPQCEWWFKWDGATKDNAPGDVVRQAKLHQNRINSPSIRRRWNDFKPDKCNMYSIMEKIERLGKASPTVPGTYVIVLAGTTDSWFEENVETILDIAEILLGVVAAAITVLSLGTGAPIALAAAGAVRALRNVVVKAARGEQVTLAEIISTAANLGSVLAQSSDPNLKQLGQDMQKYSTQAAKALDAFSRGDLLGLAKELAPDAVNALPQLTNIVGEGGKKLESAFLLANNAYADIQKIIGGNVKDIAGTVQQYSRSTALNQMSGFMSAGGSGESIMQSLMMGGDTDIMKSPIIRNVVLSENSGQTLALAPGIMQIFSAILSNPQFAKANADDVNSFADMGALVTGLRTGSNALDSLQLRGLMERAEQFMRNNLRLSMPFAISEDRRECYAKEIMQCIGLDGSGCEPPKYYHADSRTCKDPCGEDEERDPVTGDCVKKKYTFPAEWEFTESTDSGEFGQLLQFRERFEQQRGEFLQRWKRASQRGQQLQQQRRRVEFG
jgi:hypothetical protein